MRRRTAIACLSAAVACQSYDPPPELESVNVDKGLYDPAVGPLTVRFTEPVRPKTLTITLRLARHNIELDACVPGPDGELPEGCTEEATAVLGPCEGNPAVADADPDDATAIRYTCPGGAIVIDGERTAVTLRPTLSLTPYERYVLEVDRGLEDDEGVTRGVPIRTMFAVQSAVDCGPTDFEPGFFFTVFDVLDPLSIQFHFFFHIDVKPGTGEIRMFGADIDPKNDSVVQKTNRNPKDWYTDPDPPSGTTIVATGQVADIDTGRVMVVFPFMLTVAVPPVEAPGVELQAQIAMGQIPGAPGGPRETIIGRFFGPAVNMGLDNERRELGAGEGNVVMFRLEPDEEPDVTELLATGVAVTDIRKPLTNCD